MSIGLPTGFNFVPEWYVIGIDCYWKNDRPVNPPYWDYFKRIQDNKNNLYLFMDKPIAFSIDIIEKTFNPVVHIVTGATLRDSIFAFHAFVKTLEPAEDWLQLAYDERSNSFILYLPTHKWREENAR